MLRNLCIDIVEKISKRHLLVNSVHLLLHPFMGEVLFCIGFLAWKSSVPWFLVGTIFFCMCNLMSFSNDFLFFSLTISFICMNFVFINDKFADRWFESNLFVAKKIFLKQKFSIQTSLFVTSRGSEKALSSRMWEVRGC